jgi:hypothetical protein
MAFFERISFGCSMESAARDLVALEVQRTPEANHPDLPPAGGAKESLNSGKLLLKAGSGLPSLTKRGNGGFGNQRKDLPRSPGARGDAAGFDLACGVAWFSLSAVT